MDVFAKRPRLYSTNQRDFPRNFSSQHEYYDEDDELAMQEDEEEEPDYDPHTELQQRRAELDHRLKNTFESIFAKYERDFDGIGDEIDLATGEIVVNNGHLVEMMDERDAGLRNGRRQHEDSESVKSLSVEEESTENEEDEESGQDEGESEEDDEDDEDDGEEEEEDVTTTGESMDDDDLILRGFKQANRFLQLSPSPDLGMVPTISFKKPQVSRFNTLPRRSDGALSHLEILDQFGPDLGPQIVGYISQQEKAARQSHVEEAWRAPELPTAATKSRLPQRPSFKASNVVRSPSPEASASIWAMPGMQRQRKSVSRLSRPPKYKSHHAGLSGTIQSAKIRNDFTQEEDETMLEWIAKARQDGTPLSSALLWKALAAQHPRHNWQTWQARYRRKFYVTADSEMPSGEDETVGFQMNQIKKSLLTVPPLGRPDRPSRTRKPIQRDSRIVSWSEAVNTIASVDPDLHAGILDDARRAKNGEESWIFGEQADREPLEIPLKRPASAHDVDELQRDFTNFHKNPIRRFSDSRFVPSSIAGTSSKSKPPGLGKRLPCPHADCRGHSATLYGVAIPADQDASELTLHLLAKHRTTPFPCEEIACGQKGGNGYFRQEDLVQHVKSAHPYKEALHRLRDRVDLSLVPPKQESVCIDLTVDSPTVNQQEVPGFIRSSRVPSSRGAYSSPPRHDRTLTPAGFGAGQEESSISTPPTSFSSLIVNRPSATVVDKEIRDSQEPVDSSAPQVSLSQTRQLPRNGSSTAPSYGKTAQNPGETRQTSFDEPAQFSGILSDPFVEQEVASQVTAATPRLPQPNATFETPPSFLRPKAKPPIYLAISSLKKTSASRKPALEAEESVDIRNEQSPSVKMSARISAEKRGSSSRRPRLKENFTRNTIPSSHEFSDEEDPILPPKLLTEQLSLSLVAPIPAPSPMFSAPLPVTPSAKKRVPKGSLQQVISQDDVDELSLGSDDLRIISSHKKLTNQPTFGFHSEIKREEAAVPFLASVATSKKRKISDLAANDEIDELGADACFGKSTGPKTGIKKEADLNGTPMVHRIKVQRKQAKKDYREEARKSGMGLSPHFNSSIMADRHIGRSGTPLLDLTPDKSAGGSSEWREVQDSEEPLSSSASRPEHQPKVLDGLLTPTRSKQGSQDPSKFAAAIVVKTPNGTYRKCGEGRFRCRRSFCFRCVTKVVPMAV